jgi:hypothetical protein
MASDAGAVVKYVKFFAMYGVVKSSYLVTRSQLELPATAVFCAAAIFKLLTQSGPQSFQVLRGMEVQSAELALVGDRDPLGFDPTGDLDPLWPQLERVTVYVTAPAPPAAEATSGGSGGAAGSSSSSGGASAGRNAFTALMAKARADSGMVRASSGHVLQGIRTTRVDGKRRSVLIKLLQTAGLHTQADPVGAFQTIVERDVAEAALLQATEIYYRLELVRTQMEKVESCKWPPVITPRDKFRGAPNKSAGAEMDKYGDADAKAAHGLQMLALKGSLPAQLWYLAAELRHVQAYAMAREGWLWSCLEELRGQVGVMLQALGSLVDAVDRYASHLDRARDRMRGVRERGTTFRPEPVSRTVERGVCRAPYAQLEQQLRAVPLYSPVETEELEPADRKRRANWRSGLQLAVPVYAMRVPLPGAHRHAHFVWQVAPPLTRGGSRGRGRGGARSAGGGGGGGGGEGRGESSEGNSEAEDDDGSSGAGGSDSDRDDGGAGISGDEEEDSGGSSDDEEESESSAADDSSSSGASGSDSETQAVAAVGGRRAAPAAHSGSRRGGRLGGRGAAAAAAVVGSKRKRRQND